jgi:tRNA uridine 5-carboxymethylaminomethyl modification enzyme
MFTSRAEYRLLLRQDNADLRLTPSTAAWPGLVSSERIASTHEKQSLHTRLMDRCRKQVIDGLHLEHWFRRPENDWHRLPGDLVSEYPAEIWSLVETDLKYAGYLQRQRDEVDRTRGMESRPIPADFCYDTVRGLKTEARQKLAATRPRTLGQASRISGVTPADISLVAVWIARGERVAANPVEIAAREDTHGES